MDTDQLKIVRLEGGPKSRGRMHGELFGPRIADLLERWGDNLERRAYFEVRKFAEEGILPYDHKISFDP